MKKLFAVWLCVMLMFSSTLVFIEVSEDAEGSTVECTEDYVLHAPIRIDSDGDFPGIATAGNGSAGDPWIIGNWDINGAGYGYCIYIGNTTEYFTVMDCYLHEASGNSAIYFQNTGFYLHDVQNGTLDNNTALNNYYGIYLWSSSNNILKNNTVWYNNYGLYIESGIDTVHYPHVWVGAANRTFVTDETVVVNAGPDDLANRPVETGTVELWKEGNVNEVVVFIDTGVQNVLLVDDDSYGENLIAYYQGPIQNNSATVTVWDVHGHSGPAQGDPTAVDMAAYNVVIWVPDRAYAWDGCRFGPADEGEVATYLDGGGTFMMSNIYYTDNTDGSSYDYDPGDFAYDYLALDIVNPFSFNEISEVGVDTPFVGWGPHGLDWTYWINTGWYFGGDSDDLTPTAFGTTCINNDGALPAGIQYDSGTFKTIFMGFPFDTLGVAERDDAMARMLDWFVPPSTVCVAQLENGSLNNQTINDVNLYNQTSGAYLLAGVDYWLNYSSGALTSFNDLTTSMIIAFYNYTTYMIEGVDYETLDAWNYWNGKVNLTIPVNPVEDTVKADYTYYFEVNGGILPIPPGMEIMPGTNILYLNAMIWVEGVDYVLDMITGVVQFSSSLGPGDVVNATYTCFVPCHSDNNEVYHNNIISNTNQAYDDGNNSWDNGYPDGGNYWSDYIGKDNFKGPGQNESGSDGIGDIPYIFNSAQDNYPLKPWLTGSVHNIDKDTYYSTIQGAVDYADPGNTLEAANATYYENVIIDKSLTLIGEDRNTTFIDGSGTGDVVHVTADWVSITGFTVTGGQDGIELNYVGNCNIENNNVFSNNYGIRLYYSSNNTIANNNASNNHDAISLYSSNSNTIVNNTASNSVVGIYLCLSSSNTITNNIASSNDDYGIYLDYSSNNTIANNTVSSINNYGIYIGAFSNNNSITNNTVSSNNNYGIYLSGCSNNTIYHNNFINNMNQAYDSTSTNFWDNGYPSGGNYWSDYTGSDMFSGPDQNISGSDNIGDLPYNDTTGQGIQGGTGQDNYPLMWPWGQQIPFNAEITVYPAPIDIYTNSLNGSKEITFWSNENMSSVKVTALNSNTTYYLNHEVWQDDANWANYSSFEEQLASGNTTIPVDIIDCDMLKVHIWGYADAPDLDLGIFLDGKDGNPIDGITQTGEFVTMGADWDANEEAEVLSPLDGTYLIKIFGFYILNEPGHFDMKIDTLYETPGIFNVSDVSSEYLPSNTLRYFNLTWELPGGSDDGEYLGGLFIGTNGTYDIAFEPITLLLDRTAPEFSYLEPEENDTIEHSMPTIMAGFIVYDMGELDRSSPRMWVDGTEVTSLSTINIPLSESPSGYGDGYWFGTISYSPNWPLSNGAHMVTVTVDDIAGNKATKNWSFTVDNPNILPIYHTPEIMTSVNYLTPITAIVDSEYGINSVELSYQKDGEPTFTTVPMVKSGTNSYYGDIPAQVEIGIVNYYLRATDVIGNEATLPAINHTTSPYPIEVYDYGYPKITHQPVLFYGDEDISIHAVISDNIGIVNATLYFKIEGAGSYNSSIMTNNGEGHVYSTIMSVADLISNNVSYYVSATDGVEIVTHPLDTSTPHHIQYIPTAVPGGDLRVAMQDDIATLNPLIGGSYWTQMVLDRIYDGPIATDPATDKIIPFIAVGSGNQSTNSTVDWNDCTVGVFGFNPSSTWNNLDKSEATIFYDFENVTWHDGVQMSVRDVMFSYHVAAQMPDWSSDVNCLKHLGGHAGSNYPNDHNLYIELVWMSPDQLRAALKYTLQEPYADFFRNTLSVTLLPYHIWGNMVGNQNVDNTKIWSDPGYDKDAPDAWSCEMATAFDNPDPIGSGFFEFDYWNVGLSLQVITWRDHFYRPGYKYDGYANSPAKQPNIDSILFKIYKTAEAAVLTLKNNDVDYIAWSIPPTFVGELTNEPGITIQQSLEQGFFYLSYNMRISSFGYDETASFPYAPEDDLGKPFRRAVAHCIDKQLIVRRLLLNYGIAGEGPVSSISNWYNASIPKYSLDPEEAKRILQDAGYQLTDPGQDPGPGNWWLNPDGSPIGSGPGGKIEILTPQADYDPIRAQAGLMIAKQMREVGIYAESTAMDFGSIVERIDNRDFDMYILGWRIGSDPTEFLHAFFHSSNAVAGQNYPGYANISFDALIDHARQTGDEAERLQDVHDCQSAIAYDLPYDVLYFRTNIEAYRSDNFIGWQVGPSGSIYNKNSLLNIHHPSLPLPSQIEKKESGGALRVALKQEPNQLNPLASTDENTKKIMGLVYDPLARIDPYSLEIIPWVAESWIVSPGNTTVTVTLCNGVTWHDGTPVTATDVKYTYDTYALPYIASVTVIDNLTVVFTLNTPTASFFSEALLMPLIPVGFTASSQENGCGPFKFKERVNGDHLTIETYEDYFNGRPNIDSIIYSYYSLFEDAAHDLMVGDIDFIGREILLNETTKIIDIDGFAYTLGYHPDTSLVRNRGYKLQHLGFNTQRNPLNTSALRKAITYCVNKESLVQYDISGGLEVADSFMSQYNYPYWNETIPKYRADLQQANLILDEAGYFDRDGDGWRDLPYSPYEPFNLTLLGPTMMEDITRHVMAFSITDWIQQIGVNITFNSIPEPERNALIAADDYDIYFGELIGEQDPEFLNGLGRTGAASNHANYANATMDTLLDRMNCELNISLRAKYAQDCEGWLAEQLPYIPLFHEKVNHAYNNKRFDGWVSTLGGIDNFWSYLSVYPLFDPTPVDPPIALLASGPWAGSIDLTWAPNLETNLTGYNIYRANASGGPYAMIDSVGLVTAYLDSPVNGPFDYYYVITGIINGSESSYSNEAFCKLTTDTLSPYFSNEHVGIDVVTGDPRPTIWVHVLDNVAINVSTIRLYVKGFPVLYDLTPLPGGYNVSYLHGEDYTEGPISVRIVARDTSGNLLDFSWTWHLDLSPPIAWDIDPPPEGICQDTTPTIQLNVTDIAGVERTTMRLYVQGFAVWYEFSPIVDGYHVWYTHEFGFSPGEVVRCRIRAEDTFGHWLDYSWNFTIADVLTVQIPVQVGWNLISFPVIPDNTSLPVVLQDLDGDTTWENIQWYDPLDTADHWKTYATFKPPFLNDLTDVTRSMSVWLYVPDAGALGDGLIKITGLESVSTNIPLYAGWNLVGYPSQVNRTVQEALAGTGYGGVEGFNASAPYLLSPLDDSYMMKPGEGYWIHVPVDTTWTIDW